MVTDLRAPTYIAYDSVLEKLYVCDLNLKSILAYPVRFSPEPSSRSIKLDKRFEIYTDIDCRGLKTDKFGNLYFSDENNAWIGKIKKAALAAMFSSQKPQSMKNKAIMLYDGKQVEGAQNP